MWGSGVALVAPSIILYDKHEGKHEINVWVKEKVLGNIAEIVW